MYVDRRLLRTKFLPLFVQRRCPARPQKVWGHGTVSRSDGLWNFQGMASQKRKIPPTQRSDDFVGWIGGKMNQVCCGAVNLSGIIHGEAVFKMNTTTSCGWLVTNPQEQWDLQEKYHCMWKSSRGFWKIYGNKVERVGLLTAYFGFKWIKLCQDFFFVQVGVDKTNTAALHGDWLDFQFSKHISNEPQSIRCSDDAL